MLLCPTNSSDEDKVQAFYSDLTELVDSVPKYNLVILGGDFNAKIGRAKSKIDLSIRTQIETVSF